MRPSSRRLALNNKPEPVRGWIRMIVLAGRSSLGQATVGIGHSRQAVGASRQQRPVGAPRVASKANASPMPLDRR